MSKGFHRAVSVPGALVVDALSTDSILLVVNHKCCGCSFKELTEWGCVRYDMLAVPKDDVLDLELLGTPFLLGTGPSVLPNAKEVVKGNVA